MQEDYFVNPLYEPADFLSFFSCGVTNAVPPFAIREAIREEYIFHYLMSGVCIYEVDGKKYRVEKGAVFLIVPGVTVSYYPEGAYSAAWINFNGTAVEEGLRRCGLSQEHPVAAGVDAGFAQAVVGCLQYKEHPEGESLRLAALTLECFAYLEEAGRRQRRMADRERYVKTAVSYMKLYYAQPMRLSDVLAGLNIERSYFYRLFKAEMGVSPKGYLIHLRLERAKQLMASGKSVKEAAAAVGVTDLYYFSKLFSRHVGIPPSRWRREHGGAPECGKGGAAQEPLRRG